MTSEGCTSLLRSYHPGHMAIDFYKRKLGEGMEGEALVRRSRQILNIELVPTVDRSYAL
jgi:hypothetical protein